MPPATLHALLAGLIDYAGLFPPAALPMADVCKQFDAYRRSPHAWALGRVVVPAARLAELVHRTEMSVLEPWRVSALVGEDALRDAELIRVANASGRVVVDTVEARAPTTAAIHTTVQSLGDSLTVYLEIPVADDPRALVEAIARSGARAKIRTGGIVQEAFPTPTQCARFIGCCAEHGVAFKATAGLHHPVRGDYRLTYADDAPRGTMGGYLNLFVAAALVRQGMAESFVTDLLDEREPRAFHFTDDAITWRDHSLALDDVTTARTSFAMAFGSCSFREPLDDLQQLGLL